MRAPPEFFRETHLIGPRCREHSIDAEHYPVLRNALFQWIGTSELRPPYRMVRLRSVHSHVAVCLSGRGHTLIDGARVPWTPGQVLLAPVGVHHAFEIAGNGPWKLAWIFFADSPSAPALPGEAPQLVEAEVQDFAQAVSLLTREAAGAAQSAVMEALVTVLGAHTQRLAGTTPIDPRLGRLWSQVELHLAHPWSVAGMADVACVSPEHLRRLCLRDLQRSPAEHLTHLRMRRASTLLRSTPAALEDIATAVGYASMYAFSVAFRRWSGSPPIRYRRSARTV